MTSNSLVKRDGANLPLVQRRAGVDLSRPSDEERASQLNETKNAIDQLIALRSGELKPTQDSISVTYTPRGPAASKHELKIVEKQNDPLEPPRHRYRKQPLDLQAATEETRAPILRPPPRKLTAEEKKQWEVPASVSNWKNDRGFLIDLETRAAATGHRPLVAPKSQPARTSLAEALAGAAKEVHEEQGEEEARLNAQNSLRSKLLDQKRRNQNDAQNAEDMFDSRLFHSSKRKHDVYSESLFSKKGRPTKKRIDFEK